MKLKRLLTGVLSAVMALSVCAMPALADEVKTSTSTINTETKGSITIYKYAQTKDQKDASQNVNGNGEVIANPSTIQGTLLPDAEFTLYRVKNAKELVAYYNGLQQDASATEFTVSNCFKAGETQVAKNLKKEYTNNTNNNDQALGVVGTQKTTREGVAVFDQLSVGLYLVIETRTPDSVTKAVEPFLVSIPMTREATDAKGTEWLYNVTVYPKNSTVKGDVTLIKYGSNGTEKIPLEGVQFKLYRYDGLANKYIEATPTGGIATEFNGQVVLSELVKGRYVLQEIGYADSKDKNKGYILNTTGIYAFSIDDKGEVAPNGDVTFAGVPGDNGEKVTEGDGFKLDNDATNGATISITNYKPDFEKNVTKRDEASPAGNTTHDADYGIGENVPYTLTIKVPENIAKLKTFKVTDTTQKGQLIQNIDSVKVTATAKNGTESTTLEKDTAYTVEPKDSTSGNESVMTIDFDPLHKTAITAYAGGTITIAYTAKLQGDAVIADKGNFNTADLIYSRTTDTTVDETTQGNEPYQIEDKGVVYTFALNIKKTAQGGKMDSKPLDKVTFDLYKKATRADLDTHNSESDAYTFRGQPCKAITKADATKLGLPTDDNQVWLKVGTLNTDPNGEATVSGLPAGDYKLVETKTADGYNLLSEPVDAKLNLKYATEWNTTGSYENGKEIKKTHIKTTYTYNDGQDTAVPGTALNIVNRAGFTLPVTGGFGTLLFSGIGVLLVLAGVCVLFSMKKKNNRT